MNAIPLWYRLKWFIRGALGLPASAQALEQDFKNIHTRTMRRGAQAALDLIDRHPEAPIPNYLRKNNARMRKLHPHTWTPEMMQLAMLSREYVTCD